MAKFTICVELKDNSSQEDFGKLSSEILSLGFSQTLFASDDVYVDLPHGVFHGSANGTAEDVANNVHTAAKRALLKAKIFVIQTEAWAAVG